MRSAPINPILLLILVQAWARVKKQAPEGFSVDVAVDHGIQGWPEQVFLAPGLRAWLAPLLRAENLCLDDASWGKSSAGPHLCPAASSPWVSPGSLVPLWGGPSAPILDGLDQISSWAPPGSTAIGVRWQETWTQSIPGELLALLDRAHAAGVPVWMHVEFKGQSLALCEDVLRRSTQVGWSWWCPPPSRADALPAWFQAFRPAWGFWLCAPTSDQWAWPWMDMFGRSLVQKMGARAPARSWLADSRQKTAFGRIEADVWSRACDVLGGEEVASTILAQALLRLVRDIPSAR